MKILFQNFEYFFSRRSCGYCAILFLLVFSGVECKAQESDSRTGTGIEPNVTLSVVSANLSNPDVTINEASTTLELKVLPEEEVSYPFLYTLTVNIVPTSSDGSAGDPIEKILEIEYHPEANAANYTDLQRFKINGSYGANVTITTVAVKNLSTGSTGTITPGNIYFKVYGETSFFQALDTSLIVITPTELLGPDLSTASLQLSWAQLSGARRYQLEYSWVDAYGDLINDIPSDQNPGLILFSERDFQLNSTRVELKGDSKEPSEPVVYEIPLIYPKGYLLYRVRALGEFPENPDHILYGPWSISNNVVSVQNWIDNNSAYYIANAHEKNKNWQFQASYAEEGKKKEVVSYFDGTLRNRQTVTKINTENNAIVGEVIYDNQGRPAIEVLPVPAMDEYLNFYPDFNLNTNEQPSVYTHLDFDWNSGESIDDCEISANGMSTLSGASKYYSSNNPVIGNFQDYVPDASLFPFSQIQYTSDNTGRIKSKGGVGPAFQLGTGHEMKYYYSQPSSSFELNRLFGYHVGNPNHYKKNTVIDPNGQISVSYMDVQGRTIATALAGDNPKQGSSGEHALESLADELNNSLHDILLSDLLKNNEFYRTDRYFGGIDGSRINKPVVSEGNNTYEFNYSFAGGQFVFDESCFSSYPFKYDLTLSLEDDCGSESFEQGTIVLENIENYSTPAPFTAALNIGEYGLVKNLVVNQEAAALAWESYISNANQNCVLSYEDFITIVFDCAEVDCEIISLGKEAHLKHCLKII